MPLNRLTLPWDELNDTAYNGGRRLIQDLGKQVKGIACQLYRDTPGALIPNPASNFLAGMWDGICSDDPNGLPPPPAPPFTGGQCKTNYIVTGRFLRNANNTYYNCRAFGGNPVPGRILGVACQPGAYCELINSKTQIKHEFSTSNNIGYTGFQVNVGGQWKAVDFEIKPGTDVEITSVTRADGLPDDCGDLPREYPPPPPTYQPPSGDITINPRPDANNPDLNITIPFAWIEADFNLDVKPYIDVGGIKINFDIGGINFEFDSDNPPPTYEPDINPLPDTLFPPAPLPPPGWGDIQVDIDNTNNVVNDIDTKIDTKADKTDIPDYQDELDRIEDKIDNLPPPPPPLVPCATGKQNFVRVTANISNYIGKTVFTDDDNEIVVFGGYIRFLIDGEPYGEELPIRRLVHHFLMPPWATGYRLVPQNQVVLSGAIVEKTVDLPEVTLLDCSGGMA